MFFVEVDPAPQFTVRSCGRKLSLSTRERVLTLCCSVLCAETPDVQVILRLLVVPGRRFLSINSFAIKVVDTPGKLDRYELTKALWE